MEEEMIRQFGTEIQKIEAAIGANLLRAGLYRGKLGRGIVFVILIFFMETSLDEALHVLQGKNQQVCLVQVLSAEEEQPREGPAVRQIDAETGETCDLELTFSVLVAYDKALKEHRGALGEFCFRSGASFYSMNKELHFLLHAERFCDKLYCDSTY